MCELTDTLNQNICNQERISQSESDYKSRLGRKMKLLKSPKKNCNDTRFFISRSGSRFSLAFVISQVFLFVQSTLEKVILLPLN